MALTAEELLFIRGLIAEPTDADGWTDQRIQDLAAAGLQPDGTYDTRAVAGAVWESKAAEYVGLVNVSESGSSRSMGEKFDHAVTMAKRFAADSPLPAETPALRPRSTRMVRPTRG